MKRYINVKSILILGLCLVGCIQQDFVRPPASEPIEQCVTPLFVCTPFTTLPNAISMTSDGSLIAVIHTFEGVYLFDPSGDIIWSTDTIGGRFPLITKNGHYLIAQIRRQTEEDPFFLAKIDREANIIWKREIGLIGLDGLAVTPDGSFIAVGATDKEKNGHVMLFDHNGNKLWDHQIDGRVETVAVSKSGYVVAGPRDECIYVYNYSGELIFTYPAKSIFDSQDTAIAPDETYFLFGSEHTYINCYNLLGELLWQKEMGPLCTICISQDSEYIAVGTSNSRLFLFDRHGNKLWEKKVTDAYFVHEVSISAHGEYIVIDAFDDISFWNFKDYIVVYNREGELLWQYPGDEPFLAIAMSDTGQYIAAGNKKVLLFFDNFQAIKEYKSSECAHNDNIEPEPEPAEYNIFISLLKVLIVILAVFFVVFYFLKRKKSQ
jgi:outer membrane protein assembly factor BamB